MPSKTFLNLNEEKKVNIQKALIKEFSENVFKSAKISNIVSYAKIPRGSFYKYFDDLKDAYFYIIEIIKIKEENSRNKEIAAINDKDFKNSIIEFINEQVNKNKEKPEIFKFMCNFMRSTDVDVIEKKNEFKMCMSQKRYKYLLNAQNNNLIRKDVDINILNNLVNLAFTSFEEQIELPQEEVIKNIKSMMDIFINGIGER